MVIADGDTLTLPDAENVPVTPDIVTLTALGTFHESMDDWPTTMDEGEAEKVDPATVGQVTTATVAVIIIVEHVPAPDAVKV
jgi:hypothetical protein